VARLEYIDNTGSKAVFPLISDESVAIGRDPGSDIYTNNPSVSRRHGRVQAGDNGWHILDLGSSNGTFLNDEPLVSERVLTDNDQIRCGDFVITFYIQDAPGIKAPDRAEKSLEKAAKKALKQTSQQGLGTSTDAHTLDGDRPIPSQTRLPEQLRQKRSKPGSAEPGAPKKGIRAVKGQSSSDNAEERFVRQIKEQAAELETLTQDRDEARAMLRELENRLEDFETKSVRYEVELDSMAEKYVQIKDQLTLSRERLDETREELAERDDQIFQLEAKAADLAGELDTARERVTASTEHVSTFKVKLTQKERQIEDLQRQYDLMEYEFRAAREELRAIQEDNNNDEIKTQRLEKRINQLREVIVDKENVIAELRLGLENKDIEIRQVKLGMGLTDLEDEKRKLLEDYYEKNREVDVLRDTLDTAKREHQETREKLTEVKAELERKSQPIDVETHPEFKAKSREVNRLQEQIVEGKKEAEALQQQLEVIAVSLEDRNKLEGEVKGYKRKIEKLDEKLARSQGQLKSLETEVVELKAAASAEPVPTDGADAAELLKAFREAAFADSAVVEDVLDRWRSNFTLFKTYLKEVEETINIVVKAEAGTLPSDLQALRESGDLGESMESVRDLMSVVASDAKELKTGLTKLRKEFKQN
jgi:pSer/pThr/pTyr-binding forkhead associated (FHA) protein